MIDGAASILHADLDSFYASVEQRDDPALRGRPVAVGGGVVLTASYEARRFGVRSAMGGGQARRLCRELVFVAPRFSAYVEASRAVFAIFADTAPTVEQLSIDEAFLDVSGLEAISGTPSEIACVLRDRVRREVGLPITVGIARTKFLAKVASGVAKPDGLLAVESGAEIAFLHPLAVERLWGVGPKTAAKLRREGLCQVGDVARLELPVLVDLLGRGQGRHLFALAQGQDPRPVRRTPRRRSIGAQRALGRRSLAPGDVEAFLMGLVDRVAQRLRRSGRLCRTVVLRLRFADYERTTRSRTLPRPSDGTATLVRVALGLLRADRALIADRGLTLVGVSLTGLCDRSGEQLSLPIADASGIDAAVDLVRDRFGSGMVTRASLLGRGGGDSVPILHD